MMCYFVFFRFYCTNTKIPVSLMQCDGKTVCYVASVKKNAYEVLVANLIQHATPLSFSLQPCDSRSIPDTQEVTTSLIAAVLYSFPCFELLKHFLVYYFKGKLS